MAGSDFSSVMSKKRFLNLTANVAADSVQALVLRLFENPSKSSRHGLSIIIQDLQVSVVERCNYNQTRRDLFAFENKL